MASEGRMTVSISSTRAGAVVNVTKSAMTFNVTADPSVEDVRYIGAGGTWTSIDLGDIGYTAAGSTTAILLYNNDTANTVAIGFGALGATHLVMGPLMGQGIVVGTYGISLAAMGACCAVTIVGVK